DRRLRRPAELARLRPLRRRDQGLAAPPATLRHRPYLPTLQSVNRALRAPAAPRPARLVPGTRRASQSEDQWWLRWWTGGWRWGVWGDERRAVAGLGGGRQGRRVAFPGGGPGLARGGFAPLAYDR